MKSAKLDASLAKRNFNVAAANAKGDRAVLNMQRRKVERLQNKYKDKTDENYRKEYKKANNELDKRADEIGKPVDDRVNHLIKTNPKAEKAAREHDGDGYELTKKIARVTNDKTLQKMLDKADDETFKNIQTYNERISSIPKNTKVAKEQKLLKEYEGMLEKSEKKLKKAEAYKKTTDLSLQKARKEYDLAKAREKVEKALGKR